jgi:hypothetical protein
MYDQLIKFKATLLEMANTILIPGSNAKMTGGRGVGVVSLAQARHF